MSGWSLVVVGGVIGIVVSALAWFVETFQERHKFSWLIFCVTSLVGFAVGHLTDLSVVKDEVAKGIEGQRKALIEALPLLEAAQNDVLRPVVYGFVSAHRELDRSGPRVMKRIFERRLEELSRAWTPVTRGRLAVDGGEVTLFSVYAVLSAEKSVEATNYLDFAGWWDTASGSSYLTANYKAVEAGRKVVRVFVFRSVGECTRVEGRLLEQWRRGVIVYVALEDWIPQGAREDVLIVDEVVAGRMEMDGDRRSKGAEVFTAEHSVREIRETFLRTRESAKLFTDGPRCGTLH